MAEKKLYGATFGPYIYDDATAIEDPDGDFTNFTEHASISDGGHICEFINFLDTDHSHGLKVYWNENDSSHRTLAITVNGGNRTFALHGNLTVESASLVNQDLTTDAAPTFGGLTKVGDASNYMSVASDGEITLVGTARVWKNEELVPQNVGKPSTNPPAYDEYQGFKFDRYDRTTEEQVYYKWVVPHGFAEGDSSVRGYFQFFVENPPSGTGNEAVVLGFEYKKISEGDTFDFSSDTASGTITETITDGEAAYKWHYTDKGVCTTTGWVEGDTILFRFYRDATDPDDTYDNEGLATDNDVWIGVYHLEYLANKLGEAS